MNKLKPTARELLIKDRLKLGEVLREPPRGIEQPGPGRLGKTPLMLALEQIFDSDIDRLLMAGELGSVASMLGIDKTTVCKWRLKRGLRQTESNGS